MWRVPHGHAVSAGKDGCRSDRRVRCVARPTGHDAPEASHGLRLEPEQCHVFLRWLNGLSRFDNVLSSRAVGERPALDRLESGDLRGFPPGPGFARCRERATFLCLCKETLPQRKPVPKKAHPVGCARRCAPGSWASRDFSTVHPCTVEKRATSCRAPFGPDPRIPPQPGAPVDQDRNPAGLSDGMASIFPEFPAEECGDTSGSEWTSTQAALIRMYGSGRADRDERISTDPPDPHPATNALCALRAARGSPAARRRVRGADRVGSWR